MADTAPLAGLRVLDLSQYLPGPWATWQLAQLGAQVTKIEAPDGDPARSMGARRRFTSQAYVALQRGKAVLTMNLKNNAERERFLAMVAQADVVVEGFRPGVMARLGLDWPTLRSRNARLVLCSITMAGQDGPHARRAGHDINALAWSGVLAQTADRAGRPALCGLPIGDLFGGGQAALVALLAALLAVHTTGQGRHLDVSMTHTLFASNVLAAATVNVQAREAPAGHGMLTGGLPCYGIYATADDRHLAVGALEPRYWSELCGLLERPDLATRHWSYGQLPASDDARAVRSELDAIFARRTLAQWSALFEQHDCCVTPVLHMDEAMAHPLFTASSCLAAHTDAVEGASVFPVMPPFLFGAPGDGGAASA